MQFQNKIDAARRELRKAHPENTHQRAAVEAMLDQAVQWAAAMDAGLPLDEIKEVA